MQRNIALLSALFLLTAVVFTVGCSAQQTEEQALESLRQMTRDGKLPAEGVVANIESRFVGKRTGALAKLLRARIRFENKDFAGAAETLNSDVFSKQTKLADYALWLRGRSLQQIGDHQGAMKEFARVWSDYPDSLRATESKLLWADSAIRSGSADKVAGELAKLIGDQVPGAFLSAAKAYESAGDQPKAIEFYRRTYFFGAGSPEAKEAEIKLTALAQPLTPQTADEIKERAENLFAARNYAEADKAFAELVSRFPAAATVDTHFKRLVTYSNLKKMSDAQSTFNAIPTSAAVKEKAFYEIVTGYAKAKMWPDARKLAEEMRAQFPNGKLTPKAWVDAGTTAGEQRNKGEEQYFLGAALANYPNAVEIASAQFELTWLQHENNNFQQSSKMFIEHLARYVDEDTTNRGKAGYWAARDSEKAGNIADACALYEGVVFRYSANWYGYIGSQRLAALRSQNKCSGRETFPAGSLVPKAVANLKIITVAAETSTPRELERSERSEQLSLIGLFDWAIDELKDAKKTANNSPKINLALAQHYRLKGDNVNALLALAKSYPDYAQMFPEEMGREEWDIFYPLTNWSDIKFWANERGLDRYQVAGVIRQETIFNANAKSGANAYGLMQLLFPTAQSMARKYGSRSALVSPASLYQAPLNIELGTAYLKDQFAKFGRIEYVAVAYNAGPGRVPQWRATLPYEIDEFVEEIPFKETKGYVQGIIRNSAQYRRLYDENGNFKPNVGTRPLRGEIDSRPREQFTAEFPDVKIDDRQASE